MGTGGYTERGYMGRGVHRTGVHGTGGTRDMGVGTWVPHTMIQCGFFFLLLLL